MKMYKISQNEGGHNYSANATVEIFEVKPVKETYMEPGEDRVQVPFLIDIETRSWGIKNIEVILRDSVSIPVKIMDTTTEFIAKNAVVNVELYRLRQEQVNWPDGICTIHKIVLYLTPNLEVDYGKSYAEVVK